MSLNTAFVSGMLPSVILVEALTVAFVKCPRLVSCARSCAASVVVAACNIKGLSFKR